MACMVQHGEGIIQQPSYKESECTGLCGDHDVQCCVLVGIGLVKFPALTPVSRQGGVKVSSSA
jgi:hypothetical protein